MDTEDGKHENKRWSLRDTLGCLLLIALALGGYKACGAAFSSTPESRARYVARDAVEARLASPGSANWSGYELAARSHDGEHLLNYHVVDSQNALGATMRSHWLVLTRHTSGSESVQVLDTRGFDKPPLRRLITTMMNEALGSRDAWEELDD